MAIPIRKARSDAIAIKSRLGHKDTEAKDSDHANSNQMEKPLVAKGAIENDDSAQKHRRLSHFYSDSEMGGHSRGQLK